MMNHTRRKLSAAIALSGLLGFAEMGFAQKKDADKPKGKGKRSAATARPRS